jgi:hypothetical protein
MLALLPIGKIPRNFFAYSIMMLIPLLVLLLTRRDLNAYGLYFRQIKDQVSITSALFSVAIVQGAVEGWLLPIFIPNAIIRW